MNIREFKAADSEELIALWQACELTRPWNDPQRDIQRKLDVDDKLFLVGVENNKIVASVMGGYDGHRGWMNYLAVAPEHQRRGLATQLVRCVEEKLLALGCPKLNLQIRTENIAVQSFYKEIGFGVDDAVSMGKRLIPDD